MAIGKFAYAAIEGGQFVPSDKTIAESVETFATLIVDSVCACSLLNWNFFCDFRLEWLFSGWRTILMACWIVSCPLLLVSA